MAKLKDILNPKLLAKHVEDGVVSVQRHPEFPLAIFNYTHKAQHDNIWDEVTCVTRGLIVNVETDEVIARPFRKFFNVNTSFEPRTLEANLPRSGPVEVTEKLDGSLGILYRYNRQWYVATRGSFTSEQALWATEWFQRNYSREALGRELFDVSYTYLFEIIYPENRIVVKYSYRGLTLIGMIETRSGRESSYDTLQAHQPYGIRVVKRFQKSLSECMAENAQGTEAEGYALFWPAHQLRVKVKFADYVRLHRLITGINPIAVWEIMRDGGNVDALISDPQLPEEFKNWVREWKAKILLDFKAETGKIDSLLTKLPCPWNPDDNSARRTIAQHLATQGRSISGGAIYVNLALSKLCNKPRIVSGHTTHLKTWEYAVWNLVRPQFTKSYKVQEEES